MRSEVLRLEGVGLRREGKAILSGVDWRAVPGEGWAVIGANGSGKTTLLNIVAGALWPTTGAVTVLGECFGRTELQTLRRRIGWVSSALGERLPHADSVEDVVRSGWAATMGLYREVPEDAGARARAVAAWLGLGERLGQRFGTLSQGEKQRTLLARALVRGPELLILDEACSGLDFRAREEFLAALARLAGGRGGDLYPADAVGKPPPVPIVVTHHVEEIGPEITHVLALKGGQVLARGEKGVMLEDRVLSEAFGWPVAVTEQNGRYYARARS